MTTLQIVLLILIGVGFLVATAFFILFMVELYRTDRKEKPVKIKKEEPVQVQLVEEENNEITEIDIDDMLAKLEESSKKSVKVEEAVEEEVEEPTEEVVEEVVVEDVIEEVDETPEIVEEPIQEVEEIEEIPAILPVEEPIVEEKEEPKTTVIIKKIVKEGPEFDYRVRLEKIKDSEEKLEKDLDKTEKAITKYERTERRLARNQKLLDRKAGELANLNLLMYNVTDIKNVDEDKKARQEELVAHISELKASIEDAQKYLSANAEKHANNIKLRDYLKSEQVRYKEEWAELEILIAQAEGRDPITTVETHIETSTENPR